MANSKKRLKRLAQTLKDKASVMAAALSTKRHVSSIRLHVIRATTHALSAPPSEDSIAAVIAAGHATHRHPRLCIDALMERLHGTRSATVALKCLYTLHNVAAKGPLTLKEQLSSYPSYGGHNFLNLSTFRDDSDPESLQLSSWVRWYAAVLEHSLTVSRVLGYYLEESNHQKRLVLVSSKADLLYKLEALVGFVEEISHVPEESLQLQRRELVYEVVRLVGENYRCVQGEIIIRLEEIGGREMDVGELNEMVGYLARLEESYEKLVLLFVNRRKNNGFWDLVRNTKVNAIKKKKEIQGKWLTVVTGAGGGNVVELTRSTNPFLDPVQPGPVPRLSFATLVFDRVLFSPFHLLAIVVHLRQPQPPPPLAFHLHPSDVSDHSRHCNDPVSIVHLQSITIPIP
ncbi:hypothetical protein Fmac_007898 [Flemingia macrophylla]|uniref:ENTH domain-containing protein n=1 Tax=Flemingia macrophylla TaxID=520843 RepID=A0ABD1MVV8_9FABA